MCSAVPVCALMLFFTGGVFSAYYGPAMLDFPHDFGRRLYGLLLSPSRGLVVYSLVVLVPLFLTIRYWKVLPDRRLAILALAIIAMHLILVSSWYCWWGGISYGPRLLLELVPWLVLMAILSFSSFVQDRTLGVAPRLMTISITALPLAANIAATPQECYYRIR